MMNAFVDRECAAEREEDERDDERPEVELARATERVTRVRGTRGEMNAEKKERLVSGVRERVDRFGERGGGSADETRRSNLHVAMATFPASAAMTTLRLPSALIEERESTPSCSRER